MKKLRNNLIGALLLTTVVYSMFAAAHSLSNHACLNVSMPPQVHRGTKNA